MLQEAEVDTVVGLGQSLCPSNFAPIPPAHVRFAHQLGVTRPFMGPKVCLSFANLTLLDLTKTRKLKYEVQRFCSKCLSEGQKSSWLSL